MEMTKQTITKECCHTGEDLCDTNFGYTLSLINGKYKLIIIYWLAGHKPVMRYNELKRCLGNISHKTLSNTLKEIKALSKRGICGENIQAGADTRSSAGLP